MKNTKRTIVAIISIIMIVISTFPSLAFNKADNSNYDFLLSQGYTAEYLNNLTETYMQKMVDIIGEGYVDNIEIKNYIFNDNSGNNERSSIKPSSMKLTISTSYVYYRDTNRISGVIVGTSWEWAKNKPLYRGKDAVTINWNNDILSYSANSFYGEDVYKDNANDDWTKFHDTDNPSGASQGGIGYYTDLKAFKSYVGGITLFSLIPASSMKKGTNNSTTINVEYGHELSPINGLSIGVGPVSVGINWLIVGSTMTASSTLRYS